MPPKIANSGCFAPISTTSHPDATSKGLTASRPIDLAEAIGDLLRFASAVDRFAVVPVGQVHHQWNRRRHGFQVVGQILSSVKPTALPFYGSEEALYIVFTSFGVIPATLTLTIALFSTSVSV